MERNDDIRTYLRSNRKGKDAHFLERHALSDPFLYEAMEGLTSTSADVVGGLIRLDRELDGRVLVRSKFRWKYVVAAVVVFVVGVSVWGLWSQGVVEEEQVVACSEAEPRTSRMAKLATVRPDVSREDAVVVGKRQELETGASSEVLAMMKVKSVANDCVLEAVDQVVDTLLLKQSVDRFNQFADSALNYPQEDFLQENEGDVLLSFCINENGVPSQIRVVNSFSRLCNAEIIRLLVDGPIWKGVVGKKRIFATVRFFVGKERGKVILHLERPHR